MAEIKPEQVPFEVANAAWEAFKDQKVPSWSGVVAAALNAWPGMINGHYFAEPSIILPLKETDNDSE